jgi:hypothetical protein
MVFQVMTKILKYPRKNADTFCSSSFERDMAKNLLEFFPKTWT